MPREPKPPCPSEELQPALFAPLELPDIPKLVTGAKAYLHNGRTTCKDEERAASIAEYYLQSRSLLATARRFSISPNTVKAVLQVFEEAGKLDEVKQRLSNKLGLVAELATDAAVEALMAGKVPANVLPIMQGVAIEKKALLDGEATERVEGQVTAAPSLEEVRRYLQSKGIAAPALDVESTVKPENTEETQR